MSTSNISAGTVLADPRLWRDLAHTVRRRIDPVEVEDVVQATLEEALAAKALPTAEEGVRRFVFAIARQKVADVYRRRDRERRRAVKLEECNVHASAPDASVEGWVERTLPKAASAQQTFDWMLREADGETLAEIAEKEHVSAPMVRQRVSRLRRWLRGRWVKEVGALSLLLALGMALSTPHDPPRDIQRDQSIATPMPTPAPASTPSLAPVGMVSQEPRVPIIATRPPPRPKPISSATPPTPVSTHRFEAAMPKVDVSSCATPTSPKGINHITLAIRSDGTVESAVVDSGELVGRPEARCVEQLYGKLQFWKLSNRTREVTASGHHYFSFGPQEPAPFVEPFAAEP